jgi:hypothetical protein
MSFETGAALLIHLRTFCDRCDPHRSTALARRRTRYISGIDRAFGADGLDSRGVRRSRVAERPPGLPVPVGRKLSECQTAMTGARYRRGTAVDQRMPLEIRPISGGNGRPFGGPDFDVAPYGYEMTEYRVAGLAMSYAMTDGVQPTIGGWWRPTSALRPRTTCA